MLRHPEKRANIKALAAHFHLIEEKGVEENDVHDDADDYDSDDDDDGDGATGDDNDDDNDGDDDDDGDGHGAMGSSENFIGGLGESFIETIDKLVS